MADVTRLLDAAAAGDRHAAAQLLPLVYGELRKLAAAHHRRNGRAHPTALVHEAYLRLVGPADADRWEGRGHFFAAAAEAIRRILVESARRRDALKRGGDRSRADVDLDAFPVPHRADELLAEDEALDRLAAADPQAAELVTLRYYRHAKWIRDRLRDGYPAARIHRELAARGYNGGATMVTQYVRRLRAEMGLAPARVAPLKPKP